MFATGSAVMTERARGLVVKIAPILAKLPEPISVTGHTDAEPYRGGDKSNWDLSSERANATRRVLAESGIPDLRFRSVTGAADRDLLLPGDPLAAANRRIAVAILRATAPPDEEKPALGKQP
jgi:chemotaxis protein MotB